ncbi:hypothetical protein KCU95_g8920, partial [Aureobasidium melanogenum]
MFYRYPLPESHYQFNHHTSCVAYDSDHEVYYSDDDEDPSVSPDTTMIRATPMQEMEVASPVRSIEGGLTKTTDGPTSSSVLALPAEILFKIFQDPRLFEDDLANLRLVCKRTHLCATESFAKERFRGGLRLDFSVQEFERLAAICSSGLRLFLESVHFVRDYDFTGIQVYAKAHPDYSALKSVEIESPLSSADSSSALKDLLKQAKHLDTFSFSTARDRKGIHWNTQHGFPGSYREGIDDKAGKIRDREQVDAILSKLQSDCLAELNLADIIFSVRTLKALLERHRDTIRKLSIRGCGLRRGSCADLLLWVSQNLPYLEKIDLQFIYETAWGSFTPVVNDLVTKSGKESIKAYVASLQQQGKS